ncbi:MAG: DUF4097 family beta strand repeat-containing protein [Defluviitaleaceae bacterium]|nr:DUF4097 family beta strand repeat-containing protein [Defluviitaleaceae bacterium]
MKKQDFIQELTRALAPIDAQARAEIIADINEHFTEGIAHGQTEEEICKNLGQPGQIAEQVLEEYKAYKSQNHHVHPFGIDDIVNSAMESVDISGIISSALQSAADATRAAGGALERANNKNNVRIIGLDMGEGANTPWSESFNAETEGIARIRGGFKLDIDKSFAGITGIDIGLSIANIQLVPAQQTNDMRITIQGKSRYNLFEVANKNGLLFVRQKEPFFKFELFGFKSTLEVVIYVPPSFTGNTKVSSSVGNLTASGITGNLQLRTSAGNIKIDQHKGSHAHLRSSAGSIILTNCQINDINAKSSAGNVKAESQEVTGLTLGSSAGEIDVRVHALLGDANLSTSAGNVYLKAHEIQGNITAKSSAGNVRIFLPHDVNCRIDAKKPSLGNLNNQLSGNPNSPYTLRASSSIGSITLEALHQN